MSIAILKKDLFEIMQKAYPIIPLKSSLQILSNFMFSYSGFHLEISATDLDHSLKVVAKANGTGPFEVAVNARKVFEIVRELPDGMITLDLDENVLLITCESGFSCKIAGSDVRDFPGYPEFEKATEIELSTLSLKSIIGKSSFAVAKDESRAVLCGIYFEVSENRIGMVATDGHRLGSSFFNEAISSESAYNCVVSPKSVLNLTRIIDTKTDEKIKVTIGEKYISFSTNILNMCSKLVDGPYPDYTKVIPKNNPKSVIIDKNNLQMALRRVSVLSNQKTHLVKFTFSKDILEIVVSNRDIGGEARESLPVEYEFDQHSIGFNSQYLLEILDIIKTPKIKIEMNTQISACLVFPQYEKDLESDDLFLIMPLRIMEEN